MAHPPLRVVRRAGFKATPWKNGGGVTHEAMRVPPSGDPFLWRVSVAQIDASGPFSDFSGYSRIMVLLKGSGVDLRFGDGTHRTLRHAGEIAQFDGAVKTDGQLLDGPCTDLNVMVSQPNTATARVEHFIESASVCAARDEAILVFPLDRRVNLQVIGGERATLEPWDLAVLSGGAALLQRLEAVTTPGASSVFVATLKFVGGQ